jgi:hypothetical protein
LINYQKYKDEFEAFLDQEGDVIIRNGEIIIGSNFSMPPSQILLEVDETAYNEQLTEYVNLKKSEYSQIVYQTFPAPISYFYQQAEKSYDNEQHRLHLLRSTWESLIYILCGLIFGEVNFKRFSLVNVRIFDNKRIKADKHGLMSDRLGWKLEAMQKIIEYDQCQNRELLVSTYITPDIFDIIKDLNKERNSFSHIAALSEQEAKTRYEELHPIVSDLLFEMDFLEKVSLLRYIGSMGDIHKIKFNKFDGHSLQRQNYNRTFTVSELPTFSPIFNDQIILLEFEALIYNISPFIHFHFEGSHLKLCYFKKLDDDTGDYLFEIIGGTGRELSINLTGNPNCINNSLESLI